MGIYSAQLIVSFIMGNLIVAYGSYMVVFLFSGCSALIGACFAFFLVDFGAGLNKKLTSTS
jgi:hypothetical protein